MSYIDVDITGHRSFLNILEEFSPLEGKILDTICALSFDDNRAAPLATNELPNSSHILFDEENATEQPSKETAIALGNLVRLGCVMPSSIGDGGESFVAIHRTTLGAAFVRACQVR